MGLAALPPPPWLDMSNPDDREAYHQELLAIRAASVASMRRSFWFLAVVAAITGVAR